MQKAKVFQTGRSQAIRLPKSFRLDTNEVYLKKTSEGFLVIARETNNEAHFARVPGLKVANWLKE
jgi:antitoxin VapB